MIKHSQFFTQQIIASAMVRMVPKDRIGNILDLGIGDGALSIAALNRFPDARVDAVDIDPNICIKYQADLNGKITIHQGDVLCDEDMNVLKRTGYDLAVCNPPYGTIKKTDTFKNIFTKTGFDGCLQLKNFSKDIIFMCHCLDHVREGGYVAIILPDGLLSRKDFMPFRECLIHNHCIERIVQMPEKSFSNTEATTHILIVRKNGKSKEKVPVSIMNIDGNIADECLVDRERLITRMDYSFCSWSEISKMTTFDRTISIKIKRGSFSFSDLKKNRYPYLHSTTFKDGQILNCANYDYNLPPKTIAGKGDIIMCRVGKRCVGKVAMIANGTMLLSDCLYKISVPKEYCTRLFEVLCSQQTKEWIAASAHGVCSRVISKSDLDDYIRNVLTRI